jgi:shikimate kinase
MGSGKTTVGHALAELLGWTFVDLDEVIERRQGVAIREIFTQRGEPEFRRIEQLTLKQCIGECEGPMVIALGGGTFAQPPNEALLNDSGARSVFLDLPVEELWQRCAIGECENSEISRPLAQDVEKFRRLYEERLPSYRRAEVIVDARGKEPQKIAAEIAKRLVDEKP